MEAKYERAAQDNADEPDVVVNRQSRRPGQPTKRHTSDLGDAAGSLTWMVAKVGRSGDDFVSTARLLDVLKRRI